MKRSEIASSDLRDLAGGIGIGAASVPNATHANRHVWRVRSVRLQMSAEELSNPFHRRCSPGDLSRLSLDRQSK
jgi:hypothetical protein